ncbi:MAG: acyltransferase, partial [Pseudomonadota bacterium]
MKLWKTAEALAGKTPHTRNRYVDFLRAASICAVVVGHWMTPAPVVEDGALRFDHMLAFAPRSQFLTWLFQVMPVFFFVGGYANAASWSSAQRGGVGTSSWLGKRLRRLLAPIVPLILFWSLAAFLARRSGVDVGLASHASRLALIPVWFLAVYVMVTLAAPISYRVWRRQGMVSFWALVACAGLTDAIAVLFGLADIRWLNYGFIWLAMHQLGYAWREGGLERPSRAIGLALTGLLGLTFVILFLSYPVSMVTVPGAEMSNSRPPNIALLALGLLQVGVLLLAARPARKWLERPNVWAGVIVLNRIIMTL